MDPRGKTALVSGGTSGLGLAAARLLVAKQANVAVLGVGPVAEVAATLGPDVLSLRSGASSNWPCQGRWNSRTASPLRGG